MPRSTDPASPRATRVGHATSWDAADIDGDLAAGDATVTLRQNGRRAAVITVGRDVESLRAEAEMSA